MIKETWYMLYGGSSSDGMGQGVYVGRTTDIKVAKRHHEKHRKNPYSTGGVDIVTDNKCQRAYFGTDWSSYE